MYIKKKCLKKGTVTHLNIIQFFGKKIGFY